MDKARLKPTRTPTIHIPITRFRMTACSFSCFTVAKLMLFLPSWKDKVKVTSIDLTGGRGLYDHPRLMIATLTGRTGDGSVTAETCRLVWPDLNIGAATKPFLALICADGFVLRFKPVSVPIKETGYGDAEKERFYSLPQILPVPRTNMITQNERESSLYGGGGARKQGRLG
ncbi:hypothetical protein PIB30_041335 [Stylosanthes scabra]|uniref:Uncharacterized protein n=1 Tax=Stylosanthes scabra TaxID=79078 RepID=A0ABU6WHQ0_9FABA|nr:hypothetical protein [Stylosanthes scabra]